MDSVNINIGDYLTKDLISSELKAGTRDAAIRELVEMIFRGGKISDFPLSGEHVYEEVLKREKLQSTAVGSGMAFPHARIAGWGKMSMAMGVTRKGIDFGGIEEKPVNFVFMLISSSEEPYVILKAMASIIRLVAESGYGKEILSKSLSAMEIAEKFQASGTAMSEQILARDIARPVVDYVAPETSMEEATRMMHLTQFDVLPVLDGNKKYQGEITCLDIFEYGMPNFFKQLNTVSFVRHIDPFEKYFKIKGTLKVKDVFKKGDSTIGMEATLLEIIFLMTVKKKSKLFVIEPDGTLLGVIDRFSVIDKILFF